MKCAETKMILLLLALKEQFEYRLYLKNQMIIQKSKHWICLELWQNFILWESHQNFESLPNDMVDQGVGIQPQPVLDYL